jgi:tRNA A-37 threonylcarbamoyl transferase component Bud32
MFKYRTWTVLPSWRGTLVEKSLASLEAVFALEGEVHARDSESVVFSIDIAGQRFYVKRYHRTKGLRSMLGKARIRMEARNQLWFNQLGLPAAQVVAHGEDRFLGKTLRGALVTAALDGTRDLAWMAKHQPELFRNRPWREEVFRQLATITRTLHRERFCHNDLKWRNLLVTQEASKPRIYLIDCPVGQRWPVFLLRRRVIKDLACLDKVGKHALSRTQRLRFLKSYWQVERLSPRQKTLTTAILDYFKGRE